MAKSELMLLIRLSLKFPLLRNVVTLKGGLSDRKVIFSTSLSQYGRPLEFGNDKDKTWETTSKVVLPDPEIQSRGTNILIWSDGGVRLRRRIEVKGKGVYPWFHSAWMKGPTRRVTYMLFSPIILMNFTKSLFPSKSNCSFPEQISLAIPHSCPSSRFPNRSNLKNLFSKFHLSF